MRENWKYQPLGEICDILDSKRKPITKNKRLAGSIPYYGATGVLDYVKDYIFDEKLVLLGEDGAKWGAGENSAYIICGKSWVNNHAHALRPHRNIILDEFLVNYLNYSDLSESITGVTVPKLNQEKMRAIIIPVPPLSEQERIVALLDDQFAKIDALKANAASQLQAAKDLFQSALKEMLTPKEGWEEKTLKDICTSIKDGDWIERKNQSISGIRLLQTGNIGVGIYKDKSDSPHYISLDTFNRLHCEEVFEGDILLSRLPEPVGRACLVPKMEGRFITAVDCSIIKLNIDKISPEYFIFYTQTNAYFKNISSLCTGTTRQRISRKRLEEVTISFPSLPEQERIAARLDTISEKVKALQTNYDQIINLCNDLKQALLKSIFE